MEVKGIDIRRECVSSLTSAVHYTNVCEYMV